MQLCFGESNITGWQTIKLKDGGSIKLPSNFTAIQTEFEITNKINNNTTIYTQKLINAKGVNNSVVCSIKIDRLWKEDIHCNIILPDNPQIYLRDCAQNILNALLSTGSSLFIPLTLETTNNNLLCRYSVLLNNNESRLDGFCCYKDGILLYGSAAYGRNEDKYWSSAFIDILKAWDLGTIRDNTKAVSDTTYSPSYEWQYHTLDGDSRISIPKKWMCIYKNAELKKEELSAQQSGVFQFLLNVRPVLYGNDPSTFQIFRFFIEDKTSGKTMLLDKAELSEYEKEMVDILSEGMAELGNVKLIMPPKFQKLANIDIITRAYSFALPFGSNRIDTYSFVENNNIYILIINYPEKDKYLWDDLVISILNKWTFNNENKIQFDNVTSESFKKEPFVYQNHQANFSLRLPEEWEVIPESNIDNYIKSLEEMTNSAISEKYVTGFQRISDEYFTYPYMLIKIFDIQGASPTMLEDYFSSHEGKTTMEDKIAEKQDIMKNVISNMSFNISEIDRKKHILYGSSASDVKGIGRVQGYFSGHIGKNSIVWLYFYSLDDDYKLNKHKYFDQIVNSFEYDYLYGFTDNVAAINNLNTNNNDAVVINNISSKNTSNDSSPIVVIGVIALIILICFITVILNRKDNHIVENNPNKNIDISELDHSRMNSIILYKDNMNDTTPSNNIHDQNQREECDTSLTIEENSNSTISVSVESEEGMNGMDAIRNSNKSHVEKQPVRLGILSRCENCDNIIGKLEASVNFKGHIVCMPCYQILEKQM